MGVLKNFAKFTGKHLCQGHLFNKVAGLRPPTLLKRILWEGVFLWIFAKFLRTPFLKEHLWCLLSTFKRRPGHLLNVLRMFNTRTVQGYQNCSFDYYLHAQLSSITTPIFYALPFVLSSITYTHSCLPLPHLYSTHYHSFMGRNRCLCFRSSDVFVLKISLEL